MPRRTRPDRQPAAARARWPRRGRRRGPRLWCVGSGVALLLIALAACGNEEVAVRREQWPRGVAEHVDSGNAAYRSADYGAAREQFREAVRLGPNVPVAWFGLQMAEHALGNTAAADSAMARAEELGARAAGHPAGS